MTRREVVALDQLHDERPGAARPFEAVNVRDVGMVQRRQDLRFAFESRQPLGVVGKGGREHLDGDVAIEPGIARAIDLAHPSLAQFGGDLIGAEAGAGCEGHGCG